MSKKPKKTQLPESDTNKIQSTTLKPPQGVGFSFKYFQLSHSEFNIVGQNESYLSVLLSRLKDLCGLTSIELKTNRSSTLRCHPIDWKDTSQNSFGIPGEEQIVEQPYQFSLSANEYGRFMVFSLRKFFILFG